MAVTTKQILIFSFLFLFFLPYVCAVNLILNGGFENNPAGTQLPQYWGFTFTQTSGTPTHSFIRNDSYNLNGNYYYLNDIPGPQPTIYQDVTIQYNETLRLTGNYRTISIGSAPNTFGIRFTNLSTGSILETITYNPTAGQWKTFDITRQFATTSLRVSFIGQFGADDDYAIDNIALESNVPEPSLLASFFLGLFFLNLLRKKK